MVIVFAFGCLLSYHYTLQKKTEKSLLSYTLKCLLLAIGLSNPRVENAAPRLLTGPRYNSVAGYCPFPLVLYT